MLKTLKNRVFGSFDPRKHKCETLQLFKVSYAQPIRNFVYNVYPVESLRKIFVKDENRNVSYYEKSIFREKHGSFLDRLQHSAI